MIWTLNVTDLACILPFAPVDPDSQIGIGTTHTKRGGVWEAAMEGRGAARAAGNDLYTVHKLDTPSPGRYT